MRSNFFTFFTYYKFLTTIILKTYIILKSTQKEMSDEEHSDMSQILCDELRQMRLEMDHMRKALKQKNSPSSNSKDNQYQKNGYEGKVPKIYL